ncbi:MAG: hypothetical protein K2G55_00080 [Lachnospiraceae bacterium]|nr:hypothetical protein [Lachnospiraceae bacterium]MDE7205246.1 hypothetical protein [Lachnospiraceae bacterium]
MKIEWIHRNGGQSYISDITEAVTSVSWGGSVSQAARTAEITVLNAPDDIYMNNLNINIGAGDIIKLYENGESIFFGEVITAEKLSQYGTVTYSCMDLLVHLLRSTAVYNFENTTAEDITRKVCADFEIETGEIAASRAPIKKMIVDGSTIYDTIMQAYTKASRQTGDLYICRMNGTKLSVEIKGTMVQNFVLAEEYNISNTTYQETIENMVNVVKIFNDTGKQVGEVKNDDWIQKYGIYQQVYKKEKGINEVTAATNMFVGIEKKVTLDGIDGDLNCIAGNAVEVQDRAAGLDGIFWIDSDTHIWENGTHIMNLELNFKNLMDEKESVE